MPEPLVQQWRRSIVEYKSIVAEALRLYRTWWALPIIGVPGMDTFSRLAIRIDQGRTSEEAAAHEYIYRWKLALQSPVFGAPHALSF